MKAWGDESILTLILSIAVKLGGKEKYNNIA